MVRKLGANANPAKLKEVPINSFLIWAFYTGEPSTNLLAEEFNTSRSCYSTLSLIHSAPLGHAQTFLNTKLN